MSKQTGPSQNTRGKKKQAVENAAENDTSRIELQKLIKEGIKESLPLIFTKLEKRQADRMYVQPSIPESIHSRQTRTVTQSKPVTLEPKGSVSHKSKKIENEDSYHNSSRDESMGNNYGYLAKKRKVVD
ncbi:hypothetical protein L1987_69417 [Smallanthus sonchifolius]|uniref:Uncharacterized protein n=1 Tax=Smallanthus sonchifolius TaxID=185202 RepID=A0ACB9B576_9ASTR|nr:hypothetical protein L1987_69417 [Smallanthus sonchifolius]